MSEKYENGKANAVEYNEAKQNLMKAQSDELQAKYEYLSAPRYWTSIKENPSNKCNSPAMASLTGEGTNLPFSGCSAH